MRFTPFSADNGTRIFCPTLPRLMKAMREADTAKADDSRSWSLHLADFIRFIKVAPGGIGACGDHTAPGTHLTWEYQPCWRVQRHATGTRPNPALQELVGGQGRDRTADPRFFRPVLYQLSYLTKALGPVGPSVDSGGSDGI
jgi:hypothetical protein